MATSVVHRVTVFDADDIDAAVLALSADAPTVGNNFSVSVLKAQQGFCIGSIDRGDDADIDSESVAVVPIHEGVTVRPAGAQTNQRYITRQNGIDEVTFTAYDIAEGVFELDSTVDNDDGVSQRSATVTNRALIVERDGICAEVYPNVVLHIVDEPGGFGPGDDAVSKYGFRAKVLKGTLASSLGEIASGQVKLFYQPAGT